MKFIQHLKVWWALYALAVFSIGLLVFALVAVSSQVQIRERFDDRCVSEGGHPLHSRSLNICVSPDGRIIDS